MSLNAKKVLGITFDYVDKTLEGGGALKGKNCTITSITEITGGHRITFEWTLDDGTVETDTLDVMDGEKGDKGDQGIQGEKGDTGFGVPVGGVEGQILAKHSNTNYDFEWKALGTASAKNYTDRVRPNLHDVVESGAVYGAINSALSSIYVPHGSITVEELTPDLLISTNVGNVYNVTDSGTTTEYFINGAGKTIHLGDAVGIIDAGPDTILFNLMGAIMDMNDYQTDELDTPITISEVVKTTVESALQALTTLTPVGSILPFGGTTAPTGYFICDGTEKNKVDYPNLYAVIGDAFGTASDNTKFKLPDLRGEFLRGSGNNSHANQGNGGAVGKHQNGTTIPYIGMDYSAGNVSIRTCEGTNTWCGMENMDKALISTTPNGDIHLHAYQKYESPTYTTYCSTRPTNTSVNYIIKY